MSVLAQVALVAVGFAAVGALAAALVRRRVRQDHRPAHAFAAMGAAVLPVAVLCAAATGTVLAAVPEAAVAALCLGAAWAFHPTAGSRFADFERAFRTYAEQHARQRA
jgi:peptidoglycan/LPS O-acetylase OafA/YrhL